MRVFDVQRRAAGGGTFARLSLLLVVALAAPVGAAAVPDPAELSSRQVSLQGLVVPICREIRDQIVYSAVFDLNYQQERSVEPERPAPASQKALGIGRRVHLVRDDVDGVQRDLWVKLAPAGQDQYQIELTGRVLRDGQVLPNPDVNVLAKWAAEAIQQRREAAGPLNLRDLSHQTFRLSHTDTASAVAVLGMLGYRTEPPVEPVELDQLPAVVPMPYTQAPSVIDQKQLNELTRSDPSERLLILYHDSQYAELTELLGLLEKTVDVPAEQVLIEGMVVELDDDDFRDIGAQWEYFGSRRWTLQGVREGDYSPFLISFDPEFVPPAELSENVRASLRAVVQDGRAEVLSSPSVLVLNNRNAKIQVIKQIPIISTLITDRTTNLNVRFEDVGIILNIRPRISRDDRSVSMQILVEVSEAPEDEFVIVDNQTIAPTINRRVVETVARVHDNTPFIIGGLVRNDTAETTDGIPLLSEIPIVGDLLFQRKTSRKRKREVIIVLTPRVITSGGAHRTVMPKDSERFDFLDNRLFRNSYRIKTEDVFDMGFLVNNPTLRRTFADVRAFVAENPDFADRPPFAEMVAGVVPGERAVAVRMLYEIAKKVGLTDQIDAENLIFFESDPDKPAGFGVVFVESLLREAGGGSLKGYFGREYPRRVPFFHYRMSRQETGFAEVLREPTAEVVWKEVEDRAEVEQILLDAHKLTPDFRYDRFVFVIDTPSDLARLKAALGVRELARVNDLERNLGLGSLWAGRKILLPDLQTREGRILLVDPEVAEYFFKSDYYYYVLKTKLERAYDVVRKVLEAEVGP